MEDLDRCIACDRGRPFDPVYERGGWTLVRCRGCGLVFQSPQPSDEVLAAAYYHDEDFARALGAELRSITVESASRKLELLGDLAVRRGTRILDVGASSGAWLELAAARGAVAVGVEIGDAAASLARDRGLDVRTGTLGEVAGSLGPERFDLITFWDVLEHLRDPREELRIARGLLAPGGMIAATFPNVEGLYPRLTLRLLAQRTGVWEYPELPVHLFDFAPGTAARVLGRAGLEPVEVRTFATPYGFYRSTVLSPERLGSSARARALRLAFGGLRLVAYPLARLTRQGNSMFILARPVASPGDAGDDASEAARAARAR